MQFAVLTLLRRAHILMIVHKVNNFFSQKQGFCRAISLYFVSAAEIDCGDVLEDKDIKGLYPPPCSLVGLRGGALFIRVLLIVYLPLSFHPRMIRTDEEKLSL